jgi:hypothetical protein
MHPIVEAFEYLVGHHDPWPYRRPPVWHRVITYGWIAGLVCFWLWSIAWQMARVEVKGHGQINPGMLAIAGFLTLAVATSSAAYYYRVVLKSAAHLEKQIEQTKAMVGYRDDRRLRESALHRFAVIVAIPAAVLIGWWLAALNAPIPHAVPKDSWLYLEILISTLFDVAIAATFSGFVLVVIYYRLIVYVVLGPRR